MATVVVYVHGLWMTGFEGGLLRRRLARALRAKAPLFSYRSVRGDIDSNARALSRLLRALSADTVHLVGHSLGGLVIYKMFEVGAEPPFPPGRIVLLGSPLAGSRAAHGLASWRLGRAIMGRSVAEELLKLRPRRWIHDRELGVIAGNRAIGLGRAVMKNIAPSDGTIFVDETRIEGMREHLIVPVSHSGLPFSAVVARQTAEFLRSGKFAR